MHLSYNTQLADQNGQTNLVWQKNPSNATQNGREGKEMERKEGEGKGKKRKGLCEVAITDYQHLGEKQDVFRDGC